MYPCRQRALTQLKRGFSRIQQHFGIPVADVPDFALRTNLPRTGNRIIVFPHVKTTLCRAVVALNRTRQTNPPAPIPR